MNTSKILSAIIVDDEFNARNNLQNLLAKYCSHITVIGVADSVDDAVIMINNLQPEVVFLDIQMPKKNGFDLLNSIKVFPSIVFVSAHERFAIKAIKASALDFLLKPVDIEELKRVETKLLQLHSFIKQKDLDLTYRTIIPNLVSMFRNPGTINTLTLPNMYGFDILPTNEIIYLEGENNYTTFYLVRNKKLLVSKTLKEYEDILKDSGFMRIHKSTMINLLHLKEVSTQNGVEASMSDQKCLTVSRRRAPDFLDKAKKYFASV